LPNSSTRNSLHTRLPPLFIHARLLAVFGMEIAAILSSAALAFLLRFDFRVPDFYIRVLIVASLVWIPVKLTVFKLFGLDRRWARYVSPADLVRLAFSNVIGSSLSLIILLALKGAVPRSIYAIDFLLCVTLTAGLRVGIRLASESTRPRRHVLNRKRTIVYGAGTAGASLLRDLRRDGAPPYDVCGFVDDNPQKIGLILQGVSVLGNGHDLGAIAKKHRVELVLIAIPGASGPEIRALVERCNAARIPSRFITCLAERVEEGSLARRVRDVAVEDLLGRTPVHLDHGRISARLRGETIFITGAGGSIGSEICRQVARFQPASIIGFEIAESPLFHIGLELARDFPGIVFHPEIGSIQNSSRLMEVFERYRPSVVYHAAAYKHVPLMESHIFEAVENNVFGTLNVVEAARDHGVAEFVMISSDKAVRPASVMGATKRLCELLVRSLQPDGGRYVSVRLGNLLNSSGSVVPLFREQIARGGPITVTHPEMRRYFITIPEACQLVLQASAMGKGSEIFVLNMGEPVKITDLARNLILLSGLRPDHDIQIAFIGPRPGEKLFEELNDDAEGLLPTHHEKIHVFAAEDISPVEIERCLSRLRIYCRERNSDGVISVLRQVVPEYKPSVELMDGAVVGAACVKLLNLARAR
jgi:FlaA1/EpsC-like NDP-sugar epimerase